MPTPRRTKTDHLIHADVVDSKTKAGVWMGERASFQDKQRQILESNAQDLWIGLGRGASRKAEGVPSRVVDFWSSSRPAFAARVGKARPCSA